MAGQTAAERLAAARERAQIARNLVRSLEAVEARARRKRETRAKIILGGALMALDRKGDEEAGAVLRRLVEDLSKRDRETVEAAGVLDREVVKAADVPDDG